jgi:PKD repeat protein
MINKKKIFKIILLSFLFLSIFSNIVISVDNLSIPADEDSYINLSQPDANHGNDSYLKIKSENFGYYPPGMNPVDYQNISYIKFNLSSISNSFDIIEADLEIYIINNSKNSGDIELFFCTDDSWDENQITWNNAPNYELNKLDSIENISIFSQWYSFDVTNTIMSNDLDFISFVLVGVENYEYISIISKDNILPDYEIYQPKLNIYYTTNTIDGEPIANFDFSPLNPNLNEVIQFNDKSKDDDGTIISWSWDFGDGTNSNLQNPTNMYLGSGSYEVTLLVTDNDGFKSSIKRSITISQIEEYDNNNNSINIIDDSTNETKENIDNEKFASVENKFFGLFSLTEVLIIILIVVIICCTFIICILLLRKK